MNQDETKGGNLSYNMRRIRELTEYVHPSTDIWGPSVAEGDRRELITEEGEGHVVGLYHDDDVSVILADLSPGCLLACHTHDQTEIIVVVSGDLRKDVHDYVRILGPGETLVSPPGEQHVVSSKDGCRAIAITVPASPDYPYARHPLSQQPEKTGKE